MYDFIATSSSDTGSKDPMRVWTCGGPGGLENLGMGCLGEIILDDTSKLHATLPDYADPSPHNEDSLHSTVSDLASAVKQLSDIMHVQTNGHKAPSRKTLELNPRELWFARKPDLHLSCCDGLFWCDPGPITTIHICTPRR